MTKEQMKNVDRFLSRKPTPVWDSDIVDGKLSLEELQAIVSMQCEIWMMLKKLTKKYRL